MRALWSDRQNCSYNVSQKVKRIRRLSEFFSDIRVHTKGLAGLEKRRAFFERRRPKRKPWYRGKS